MGVTATLSGVEQDGKNKRLPEPGIVVVFGASGDLTKRKLLPALFHLKQAGLLREEFAVVGVARRDLSETFVPDMKDGIFKGGASRKSILGLIPFWIARSTSKRILTTMTVSKGSSTTFRSWMKSSARAATGCSTWRWHPSILPTSSPDLVHMAWHSREKRGATGSGS